jgi:hypothetical protein
MTEVYDLYDIFGSNSDDACAQPAKRAKVSAPGIEKPVALDLADLTSSSDDEAGEPFEKTPEYATLSRKQRNFLQLWYTDKSGYLVACAAVDIGPAAARLAIHTALSHFIKVNKAGAEMAVMLLDQEELYLCRLYMTDSL